MIEFVPQTGSTSADLAARLARREAVPEGHWLVADRQTAGRGRLGREWQDGAGNFMGSTVVHLRAGDPAAATLALVAGLSLHQVVGAETDSAVRLKWPNDLLCGDAKLAGILLERVGDAVVVGIGANLANAPSLADRATVALADLGGPIERDEFAASLAEHFAADLERWRGFGLGPVISRWLAAGHPIGTRLTVVDAGIEGTFAGLAEDGGLQLRLADGSLRVIHAGETRIA